ncbi:hypothetical protein [Flavobacterium psychrotrophum]|uniref:hypothetical protein n=1 Tax=Flavobacterium psychrotrophum TaxID=2294119 RepID=UPI000E3202EF|nr:hypothetical protein [Flavobacterium psychrotrophum]
MNIITNKAEIKRLQQKLESSLSRYATEEITVLTGHKGNSLRVTAFYSEELNMWWYFTISEGRSGARYWNAFGTGKPKENKLSNIVCEINYPVEGINKRVAAVWMKDAGENILLHSGKIGGGRIGVGKVPFQEKYIGEFKDFPSVELSGKYTEIGKLNSPTLPQQIKLFVEEVDRIKKEIVSGTASAKTIASPLEKLKTTYNEEFSGTKEYVYESNVITSICNHGLVANGLKEQLIEKGFMVANDQQRDLYLYNKVPKITHVFEIKTAINSQVIFTAVGQLMVNNSRIEPKPKLLFVVPEKLNKNLIQSLKKLNIEQLVYTFQNNKPIFKDLDLKL